MIVEHFPAHDELGTCKTILVSPEQPVLSNPEVSWAAWEWCE